MRIPSLCFVALTNVYGAVQTTSSAGLPVLLGPLTAAQTRKPRGLEHVASPDAERESPRYKAEILVHLALDPEVPAYGR